MRDHLGSRRVGAFEAHTVVVGPNSARIYAYEFGVTGSTPPMLESPEEDWTKEEREVHDRYMDILDAKFEALYLKHKVTPEAAHAATAQAIRAAEALKEAVDRNTLLDAAFIANRDLNERLTEENRRLEEAKAKLEEEHERLDATLELKRAVLATQEKGNGE